MKNLLIIICMVIASCKQTGPASLSAVVDQDEPFMSYLGRDQCKRRATGSFWFCEPMKKQIQLGQWDHFSPDLGLPHSLVFKHRFACGQSSEFFAQLKNQDGGSVREFVEKPLAISREGVVSNLEQGKTLELSIIPKRQKAILQESCIFDFDYLYYAPDISTLRLIVAIKSSHLQQLTKIYSGLANAAELPSSFHLIDHIQEEITQQVAEEQTASPDSSSLRIRQLKMMLLALSDLRELTAPCRTDAGQVQCHRAVEQMRVDLRGQIASHQFQLNQIAGGIRSLAKDLKQLAALGHDQIGKKIKDIENILGVSK